MRFDEESPAFLPLPDRMGVLAIERWVEYEASCFVKRLSVEVLGAQIDHILAAMDPPS